MAKPSQFTLKDAIRPNILSLLPYRCARDDYPGGEGVVLLDANENAIGHGLVPLDPNASPDDGAFDDLSLNRYPDPLHLPLKQLLCDLRSPELQPEQVFFGVGSDEAIDLLFRITCKPAVDRVLVCPPTYGMYSVCAQINDIGVVKVPLYLEEGEGDKQRFYPDTAKINATLSEAAAGPNPIKLTFLCSPGNPTGTLIPLDAIRSVLSNPDYKGLVVVDEAYIDFAPDGSSAVELLVKEGWENLVIMQTLSKGFGLAAIRLGIAISTPSLIQILNNIKAPYNISTPTASLGYRALSPAGLSIFRKNVATLIENRKWLERELMKLPGVLALFGTGESNFVLAQIGKDGKADNTLAQQIYLTMAKDKDVVVRFRGNEPGCEGCLRITVGTKEECQKVIETLAEQLILKA